MDLCMSHLTWPRQKHLLHKLTWSKLSKLHHKVKFEIDMAYISFWQWVIIAIPLHSPTSSQSSCFEVYIVSSVLLGNTVVCFSPNIFSGDCSVVLSYISLYTIFGFVIVLVLFCFFSSKTKEAAVMKVTLFSETLQPSSNKTTLWV